MADAKMIRVLIVDDHAMVRNGLRQFIDTFDDLSWMGEARNGSEAIEKCLADAPDVVLMDLVMPGMNGSEATRRILEQNAEIKIIILTSFYEQELVEQALQAGATSYLLKSVSAEDLAQAIRSAYAGHSTLAPEAADALIRSVRNKQDLGSDLSEREREVLGLLAAGLSNAQIADHLSISLTTVKFHVGAILAKLGVNSRSQAIALAWKHNLVGK